MMIIAVSGTAHMRNDMTYRQQQSEYQRRFYQPINKTELKREVARDFEQELTAELNKYRIDIII
jgi:hypothetical protein